MYIIRAKIVVIVHLSFLEIIAMVKVIPLEVGTLVKLPCDHVQNDSEVRLVQWYKSTSSDEFQNGGYALAWWNNGVPGNEDNYQIEISTFSLIIHNTEWSDEGFYKCFVSRGEHFDESNYYLRAIACALPREGPVIEIDPDFKRIRCTVDHVYPLIYPVFDLAGDKAHIAEQHGNRTYKTSVISTLPHDRRESLVECSFSYLHYHQSGSLRLPANPTIKPTSLLTESLSLATSVISADDGYRKDNQVVLLSVMVMSVAANIMVIIIVLMIRSRMWIKLKGLPLGEKDHESRNNVPNGHQRSSAEIPLTKNHCK